MLPILAVVVVLGFLVLHFTGVLNDLGQRRIQGGGGGPRSLNPAGHMSSDRDMDRRLKVFENFIENLTRPTGDGEDETGSVGQDNSPKD